MMKTILFALIIGSFTLLSVGFVNDEKPKNTSSHPDTEKWDAGIVVTDIWQKGVTDETEAKIVNFRKLYPKSKHNTEIDSVYRLIYPFRKGALFPQICLKDSIGKEYCITDFKGKIVYLDIWGTFCSPCVKNLREMERLVFPKLKDRDKIVFVSLDLEKDRNLWLNALKKEKFYGLQVHELKDRMVLIQKLASYAIPRNFVIDGNGRMFKFEAPLSFINEGKDLAEILNSAVATLE